MVKVNIYTTPALAQKFCNNKCILKQDCKPEIKHEGSPVIAEQSLHVLGLIAQSECPIANRSFVKENWSPGPWGCERQNG